MMFGILTSYDRARAMAARVLAILACAATVSIAPAHAKNIDLSTVPARDQVELTIYNSEDLTLVRETRQLSFAKGINRLQFSWANTLIDPSSVEIRFPGGGEKLDVLDTTFPHDKPQMLYWNVESDIDGAATVEITYFTSGLSWEADYVVITDAKQQHARIESFIKVHNRSGEAYDEARVRVVVGTINLVEQVAELARRQQKNVRDLEKKEANRLRLRAAKRMLAPQAMMSLGASQDSVAEVAEKQIIKEGLSEYFIYSIEGTESIPDGWSKRLRSFDARDVPVDVVHRLWPQQYGRELVRVYLLKNDTASGLGTTPLPGGTVQVFREAPGNGLVFQASLSMKYVPIGDKLTLNLGRDPDVTLKYEVLKAWRDEIWMKLRRANTYVRVADGLSRIERDATVAGWNENVVQAWRVENFSTQPIRVEIRRQFSGDAVFRAGLPTKRYDYRTVDFSATLAPATKKDLLTHATIKKGRNAKQQRVDIVPGDVARPTY